MFFQPPLAGWEFWRMIWGLVCIMARQAIRIYLKHRLFQTIRLPATYGQRTKKFTPVVSSLIVFKNVIRKVTIFGTPNSKLSINIDKNIIASEFFLVFMLLPIKAQVVYLFYLIITKPLDKLSVCILVVFSILLFINTSFRMHLKHAS